MDVRPLRSESDYERALAEIDGLLDSKPGSTAFDRLDVLSTLVEKYEEEHHAIPPPDPIDAILFAMEQRGWSRKDLEPLIGPRGRVAEVLNRRRPLSITMIRSLHEELGIPADVLIQEVKAKPRSATPHRSGRQSSVGTRKKSARK